jgi:PPP family 3-phenylpropionic acid transporter
MGLGATAIVALGYLPAHGLLILAVVVTVHTSLIAPLTPVADALVLVIGQRQRPFLYGWLRGAGSAAFVVGSAAAGQAVGWAGLGIIVWMHAIFFAIAAVCATHLPKRLSLPLVHGVAAGRPWDLLRIPMFVRLMVVAALIGGSHAMHDGFEVIWWRTSGMGPGTAGLLWAESVSAEVLVFFLSGRVN